MPKFGSIRSNKSFKSFSYVFRCFNTRIRLREHSREKLLKEIMTGMSHLVLENMQRPLVHKDCYLLSKEKLQSGES